MMCTGTFGLMMLTFIQDGTVRRKSIISESLLLLLQYGLSIGLCAYNLAVSSLKLDTFNVHLDPTAEPSVSSSYLSP